MGAPATIGPGLGAFIAFFFLALALWLLMRNMSARMRRMAYRERDRIAALEAQQAQQAQQAREGEASGGGDSSAGPPRTSDRAGQDGPAPANGAP
jgi:hypothetical protein